MRIGIDARFLTHPQLGGFKTYTENLINALIKVDHGNQYMIYVDRPNIRDTLPQVDNFTYRVIPVLIPYIGMPFREQFLLRRIIAKDKLDIVHFLCNTAPINIPGKYVLSLLDVIQVTDPQKFPYAKGWINIKRWAIDTYSKWTILNSARNASRVITLSQYEKEEIVKVLNIPHQRVNVTLMAANSVYFPVSSEVKRGQQVELRKKHNLPEKFILGVGYEPRKNIPILIEAFSRIAPDHPDLSLVVVAAEENRRQYFKMLADQLNLNHRVVIMAAMKPSDLAILYNSAEVFIFPSERESFGLPPLEALACGTPTIAMNLSSLPEILEDGAMLIDGKDIQTWANAIEQVISDQDFRSNLIKRGLKQAAKLTWQRCAEETMKVYSMVIEET